MAQKFLFPPGSGINVYKENSEKVIKVFLKGCANRPFFHIGVQEKYKFTYFDPMIEQLGTFDPIPNKYNEKLIALNYERIDYWLKNGARLTRPVKDLLGLAGYFPITPRSMQFSWKYRRVVNEEMKKQREKAAEALKKSVEESS